MIVFIEELLPVLLGTVGGQRVVPWIPAAASEGTSPGQPYWSRDQVEGEDSQQVREDRQEPRREDEQLKSNHK